MTSHSTLYLICSRQSYVKYQPANGLEHSVFYYLAGSRWIDVKQRPKQPDEIGGSWWWDCKLILKGSDDGV
jgi:hypothetical protein